MNNHQNSQPFKAGFISLIGKPNAGKSTLMNRLLGERLSIITSKAQTTRHRIRGIVTGENFQFIYSDTPGIIEPKYKLHEKMMHFVSESLTDADVILWVTSINERHDEHIVLDLLNKVQQAEEPPVLIVLVNKIDLSEQSAVLEKVNYWQQNTQAQEVIPVSALHDFNISLLQERIAHYLPEHPPFFPEDSLTDRTERFFAAEMIREQIFEHYEKEVPYCTSVVVKSFKEEEKQIRIQADIYVERDSQKGILIGKGGQKLRYLSEDSRRAMKKFFGKEIFLQTYVKVDADWRNKSRKLSSLGYE